VDDPIRAALGAARELVDRHGGRAALHVESLLIRRGGPGPPTVYGAAVERPEAWMPPEPWSGVALTEALERALPEDGAAIPSEGGGPEADVEGPLLGRERLIAALAASAAAAFDGTCPALFTLIGDAGLGKTRLVAEAARAARAARPDALVLSLRAAHPIHGGAAEATRALLDALEATARPAPAPGRHAPLQALAEGLRRRALRGPVAVILDDAHQADEVLLDALECATLDGAGVRLWAVVAGTPHFEQARRGFGLRNQRHDRVTLPPLDEAQAMALAARFLLPAEYPPADVLRRLSAWAGGNPGCLREIVRSLKRAGIVRRRPAGGHYVATAEVDALTPSPAWQWLAARQLDALPPELAACVRVCAALGVSFDRAELERVLDALDRAGGAGTPIDAGFGLDALVERGILLRDAGAPPGAAPPRGGGRCSFRNAVLRDAVHEMLEPGQREQIHRHALAHWRARAGEGGGPEALEPLARHAAACGERADAADAYLRLGDIAAAGHRHVDADHHYTAALAVAEGGGAFQRQRARAFAGRGRSRYRVHRAGEARADFAAGLSLAEALGDRELAAHLLLEDATALDWLYELDESARRVEEARPLVLEQGSAALMARLQIADGRTAWRQRRLEESIELLSKGVEGARAVGDHDARIVGLLILSFELACAGRLDEAEVRFDEVIALVTVTSDLLHLCTAYANRVALWIGRWSVPGAVEDLRRAVDLAREIGNPWLEKIASHNVALLLYWSDRQAEACALARRARWLEERAVDRPPQDTTLLLSEILLALGDHEEAARLVAWIERSCAPGPGDLPGYYMLQLVLTEIGLRPAIPSGPTWEEVARLSEEAQLPVEPALTLLYWRARMALRGRRLDEAAAALDAARARRGGCPMWLPRFADLERELGEMRRRGIT
jgi:tetratricopeptide (TPR) repeat protein